MWYMCTHVQVCGHVCTQRLSLIALYFTKAGPLDELGACSSDRGIPSLPPGSESIGGHSWPSGFYEDSAAPKYRSHCCVTRALSTELSPQLMNIPKGQA